MGDRLESWKEIAAYLGREVRTVQRWAAARSLPVHRLPGGERPRVFSLKSEIDHWVRAGGEPRESPAPPGVIAVLPFLNLTGANEGEHFGDGLADDIINALVRIPALRVTARTSAFAFGAKGRDVREIGACLNAAWLIEGSVRRDGDRVRVSAQLVNTTDGCHAWSECYDRRLTDLFAIQDDIAQSIAQALKATLGRPPAATPPTRDVEAYELWVRGRSVGQRFTPDALAEARACYEAAIRRDPRFARPYFGLAELLFYRAQFGLTPAPDDFGRARDAIARSLELDDHWGEAHALAGVFHGILEYDWPAADASFRRALALSPGSAAVLSQHAWYNLVPQLQLAEALDQSREAVSLDPLSPMIRGFMGLVLVAARQYTAAARECREAVQLAPLWWLRWFYATALLLQGRLVRGFNEARAVYEEVHQPLITGAMACIYGLFLRPKKAKQMLAELEAVAPTGFVPPTAFALAYMGLQDERAFEWFDKAIDARDPIVTHLPSMPLYDGIRDDPRFPALLARMNLGRSANV